MIVAILPAAGKSQRMGQAKLLLPLGPRRVIEHVLDALAASHVDRSIVVVPPAAHELRSIVERFPTARVAQLGEPTPDMRSSVLFGLEHVERLFRSRLPDAFLVVPADHPTVTTSAVNHLLARFRAADRSIVVPTFGGRRGHPLLVAWRLVPAVRALPADSGLNHLLAQCAIEVEECPLDDPSLLDDLDTPTDYERLLASRATRAENKSPVVEQDPSPQSSPRSTTERE
jgi:molybdenum cofactor cytidylyltransferase